MSIALAPVAAILIAISGCASAPAPALVPYGRPLGRQAQVGQAQDVAYQMKALSQLDFACRASVIEIATSDSATVLLESTIINASEQPWAGFVRTHVDVVATYADLGGTHPHTASLWPESPPGAVGELERVDLAAGEEHEMNKALGARLPSGWIDLTLTMRLVWVSEAQRHLTELHLCKTVVHAPSPVPN